jgi:hypothetical protein
MRPRLDRYLTGPGQLGLRVRLSQRPRHRLCYAPIECARLRTRLTTAACRAGAGDWLDTRGLCPDDDMDSGGWPLSWSVVASNLVLVMASVTVLRRFSEPDNFVTHSPARSRPRIRGVAQITAGMTAPRVHGGCCSEAEIGVIIGIELALPSVPLSRFGGRVTSMSAPQPTSCFRYPWTSR